MNFVLLGKARDVFGWIAEMRYLSANGGGVIYRGYLGPDNTPYVYRSEVPAGCFLADIGKVRDEILDPAPSRALWNHSSEFNWGYGGSGPAQLALALILDATGSPGLAIKHHQDFKFRFVAGWGASWKIHAGQIKRFAQLKEEYQKNGGI